MTTDETIAEIEALIADTIPRPWRAERTSPDYLTQGWSVMGADIDVCSFVDEEEARFIAASRTAVPILIDEIKRLRELTKETP